MLDRFAIGDFRLLGIDLHLVALREPFPDDGQVQLAHAGHHQLFGLRIAIEVDRAVFFDDLVQRAGELAFVAAALGRDGQADHRRGELDGPHRPVAERGAGVQLFDLGDRHNVAGSGGVDRLRFAPLHFQELADLDVLAAAGDVHAVVLLERAGVDADEAQLLHEGVDAGLEDLGDERAAWRRP